MQIEALRGQAGMMALLQAFHNAAQEFKLDVMVITPIEPIGGSRGYHLLFTIGATTAALSLHETRWFADRLINVSDAPGRIADDLERFGRMMLSVLADAPGQHGVH